MVGSFHQSHFPYLADPSAQKDHMIVLVEDDLLLSDFSGV
jgi:hypothetical protein